MTISRDRLLSSDHIWSRVNSDEVSTERGSVGPMSRKSPDAITVTVLTSCKCEAVAAKLRIPPTRSSQV